MMNWIRLSTVTRREIQRFARIPIQTLVSPWISALLYIFIFGYVIGKQIQLFDGISYIDFVLPGILMMNIVTSAYGQSSSSLYFHRFGRAIEEMLVSPLSYFEMVLGYIAGSVARAVTVGLGVYIIALLFTAATIAHVGLFLFYAIIVAIIFGSLGLLVALWAEKFEHLTVLQTFVITPLLYVSGVFNSVHMLPPVLQKITYFNPFFYIVDGLRYAMIDYHESHLGFGALFLTLLAVTLVLFVLTLFKKGWKLRN